MAITTILLDLDGTLLTMDNDEFTKGYFKMLVKKMAPLGYDPEKLVDSIWVGTRAMIQNDGSRTNMDAFWSAYGEIYGEKAKQDEVYFEEFYRTDFDRAVAFCEKNDGAREMLDLIHEKDLRALLATNPIFPGIATEKRMHWACLELSDFELVTTYENIGYGKPNPEYYREITRLIGVPPQECLMVGNDVEEDILAAESVGMDMFLLTDHIINRRNSDITRLRRGGFAELLEYIRTL